MKLIICFLVGCSAFAQPDIATIVDSDPFDPDRGRKEVVEEEIMEEEAPKPLDLPTLDGTMVIGKKKLAMFTYMEEGKRRFTSVTINQTVAGYKLTQIKGSEVQLVGSGSPVTLRLFNGEKTNRGGTKSSRQAAKARTPRANRLAPNAKKDDEPVIISPNSEDDDDKKKPTKRFVPRKPTTKKKDDDSSKRYKKRF